MPVKPKRVFNSEGSNALSVGTYVLTKYGERGVIHAVYPECGDYHITVSYGRAGDKVRTRDQMRPISRAEFITYHQSKGNTGMLSIMDQYAPKVTPNLSHKAQAAVLLANEVEKLLTHETFDGREPCDLEDVIDSLTSGEYDIDKLGAALANYRSAK